MYDALPEVSFILVARRVGVDGANNLAELFQGKVAAHIKRNFALFWVRPRKGGKAVIIKGDLSGLVDKMFELRLVRYRPGGRDRANRASDQYKLCLLYTSPSPRD